MSTTAEVKEWSYHRGSQGMVRMRELPPVASFYQPGAGLMVWLLQGLRQGLELHAEEAEWEGKAIVRCLAQHQRKRSQV